MATILDKPIHHRSADKCIVTRENDKSLATIRQWLQEGKTVEVINDYESFYGVGFADWLKSNTEDLTSEVKDGKSLNWTDFPSYHVLFPKKKKNESR